MINPLTKLFLCLAHVNITTMTEIVDSILELIETESNTTQELDFDSIISGINAEKEAERERNRLAKEKARRKEAHLQLEALKREVEAENVAIKEAAHRDMERIRATLTGEKVTGIGLTHTHNCTACNQVASHRKPGCTLERDITKLHQCPENKRRRQMVARIMAGQKPYVEYETNDAPSTMVHWRDYTDVTQRVTKAKEKARKERLPSWLKDL